MTPPERLQDTLAERLRNVIGTLNEVAEHFDRHADVVDGDYGRPAPNREMILLLEVSEAIAALEAAAALSVRGWQDIASAPKDGTEFLAVTQSGTQRIDRFLSAKQGQWNARSLFWEEAPGDRYKLWQPLPATPPSEG